MGAVDPLSQSGRIGPGREGKEGGPVSFDFFGLCPSFFLDLFRLSSRVWLEHESALYGDLSMMPLKKDFLAPSISSLRR